MTRGGGAGIHAGYYWGSFGFCGLLVPTLPSCVPQPTCLSEQRRSHPVSPAHVAPSGASWESRTRGIRLAGRWGSSRGGDRRPATAGPWARPAGRVSRAQEPEACPVSGGLSARSVPGVASWLSFGEQGAGELPQALQGAAHDDPLCDGDEEDPPRGRTRRAVLGLSWGFPCAFHCGCGCAVPVCLEI